jgi:hypothetical protein
VSLFILLWTVTVKLAFITIVCRLKAEGRQGFSTCFRHAKGKAASGSETIASIAPRAFNRCGVKNYAGQIYVAQAPVAESQAKALTLGEIK